LTTLDQAVAQMRANGMPDFPSGAPRLNAPGIIRYGTKKRAWYRLFEFQGRNGRSFVAGAYGVWGQLEPTKIESDWSGMDEAERARIQASQEALEKREREKRERLAAFAALRGRRDYRHALDVAPCPYLERKGVEREARLKFLEDGTLVVPAWRFDEDPPRFVGVQKIAPDGTKRFNKGMAKQGAAMRLGKKPIDGEPVLIAEGVATGLSVRAALERSHPLFVAFDAGNLLPVARIVRQLVPHSPIVICADDDWKTEGNPGLMYATKAAGAVGNAVAMRPEFSGERDPKWTDFNDLHQAEGLEKVREQVTRAFSGAGASPSVAGAQRSKKKTTAPADPNKFKRALEQWTLISGTDTVFDAGPWAIVKLSHLKISEGEGVVRWWLDSAERKTVWRDEVVFEPRGAKPGQLNLFRGMPTEPNASAPCERLLELLQYLCGEEGRDQAPLTDWTLKWAALPLQRPGAKMRTAIVMHGADEGTGKNMFWGAIRDIYGAYSGIVTQSELESQFNGWASQKLFLVANEVVSRLELRHQTGRLKNLITEPEILINEKMLPLRQEGNHINFAFLSNETQPMILGHKDRRYCVIRTPAQRPEAFYRAVSAELAADGVAGLYHYLLQVDLTGFDEFTPPPMTDAKERLIELGMNSAQLFAFDWKEERLEYPWCACRAQDLYSAYRRWCARTGERMPMTLTRFSGELNGLHGLSRSVRRVAYGLDGVQKRQATLFAMELGEKSPFRSMSPDQQILAFADSLRAGEAEGNA
jgi:putative DNA primase/helicase